MPKPIDLVVGQIRNLDYDRHAGWEAFFKMEYENEKLKEEVERLKKEIRRLKSGRKIKR